MVNDVLSELDASLVKALEAMKRELAKVRTGRANLAILDGIKVEYYGTPTPLNQVASVAVADARLITIKPWERKLCVDIERAVREANLGINPSSDGELVRLRIGAESVWTEHTLAELEPRLVAAGLLRVHRRALLSLAHVDRLRPLPTGGYLALTRSGDEVPVFRQEARRLRQRLGIARE